MTDKTATDTTANVDTTDADTAPQNDTQPQEQADDRDTSGGNKEAAKYRRQLRDAEAQRDQLAAVVENMQRAEAQRLTAGVLADPADLWRDGAELADLLDGAGNIDEGKVSELAAKLAAAHPHWVKKQASVRGLTSGATGPVAADPRNWSTVLRSGSR